MKSKISKLAVSILICELAGIIGSFFTTPEIKSWYVVLIKPTFSPPNWIFGPVWIILYILMGVAFYLIWKDGLWNKKIKFATGLFLIHLVFNALWSIVFFGLHSPLWGLVVILILWAMIIFLILKFYEIKKWAGYLLIPYFLWVSFATVLNYYIWYLNF